MKKDQSRRDPAARLLLARGERKAFLAWALALTLSVVGGASCASAAVPATAAETPALESAAATPAAAGEPTLAPTESASAMTASATRATQTRAPTESARVTTALKPTPGISPGSGVCARLADYLADPAKGQSVAAQAVRLNGGASHNACVYTVSEALRRVGCDIPLSTNYTAALVRQLLDRGFIISRELLDLQAGDICFTTDAAGKAGGTPTHTFIFLGWTGPDEMDIFDNQTYDYGSPYHARFIGLTFLNGQADQAKDATAFFMHK